MKRTAEGQPSLSVCLISRNSAATLEACLKSVRERVPQAEIVVVDTMSSDFAPAADRLGGIGDPQSAEIAKRYADVFEEYRGPNNTWTREMYAFDDAAAARQRSFDLASGKWLMWIDADDILPGPEEAERLLRLNGRWEPREGIPEKASIGERISLDGLLERIGKAEPELEGFWAPYLYRSDEEGRAITWQLRERIVRNNKNWHWQRKAHEVLVPVKAEAHRKMSTIAHLLFVHKKKFTGEDQLFSLKRHFDILIKDYDAGVRNLQDILYLENYSQFLCGERREEFIAAAMRHAHTPCDRARANIRKANLATENGYFHDAVEALAGATTVDPSYPDSFFAMASLYAKAEMWGSALEWYQKGCAINPGHPFSDVSPRQHLVEMRIRGSLAAREYSKALTAVGAHAGAQLVAQDAVELASAAYSDPCIGPDRQEAAAYLGAAQNERDALVAMDAMYLQWKYLVKNDETQKAFELCKLVPHSLLYHPLVEEMRKWGRQMHTHLTDQQAYAAFYEAIGTDVMSLEAGLTPESALPRVRWLIGKLQAMQAKLGRPLRILEMGPFDGITAIPVMKALPDCDYTAIEAQKKALDALTERVDRMVGGKDRFHPIHGMTPEAYWDARRAAKRADGSKGLQTSVNAKRTDELSCTFDAGLFDAVILFEVIEHVQEPETTIDDLLHLVGHDVGSVFLSTPWGAFDRGHHPPNRDPRGHVRALMPANMVALVERAGGRVVELGGSHAPGNYGDTLHCEVKHAMIQDGAAAFVVPSALWNWNASHVLDTGIGASEETIVFLARELAKPSGAALATTVYGPVPKSEGLYEEEVRDGVGYFAREALSLAKHGQTFIVSRAPGYGKVVREKVGAETKMVLWLQDAWYPDLNAEVAKDYEKIVVLSEWHREMMRNHGVPLDKLKVIPNFLIPEHFAPKVVREPHRFIYASSPDRGLVRLLKMWPNIRDVYPDATLGIFYGWEGCMKLGALNPGWNERYRTLREDFLELRNQPGIEERGRVNHETIALEMKRASVWAYPTDFDETFCSNAIKARAAGCVPVCTPRAALNESAACEETCWVPGERQGEAWDEYEQRFVAATIDAVNTSEHDRDQMSAEAIAEYDVNKVAKAWQRLLADIR